MSCVWRRVLPKKVYGRGRDVVLMLCIVTGLSLNAVADAQPLPVEVRVDLAITALEIAIRAEAHEETLRQIDQLRELDESAHGGELLFYEAEAAKSLGLLEQAHAALTRFLSDVGRESPNYDDALKMMLVLTERREAEQVARRLARQRDAERYAVRTLNGHTGRVHAVSFSRNGKYLASSSNDGTVRLWRVEDARPLHVMKHEGVRNVMFSADGALLVSVSPRNNILKVWNVADGRLLHEMAPNQPRISTARIYPDGTVYVDRFGDEAGELWSLSDGRRLGIEKSWYRGRPQFRPYAIAADGISAAMVAPDGAIRMLELNGARTVWRHEAYEGRVTSLRFTPDARFLVAHSDAGVFYVWDASDGRLLSTLTTAGRGNCSDYDISAEGGVLLFAANEGRAVQQWTIPHAQNLHTLMLDPEIDVCRARFGADGNTMLLEENNREGTGLRFSLWTRAGEPLILWDYKQGAYPYMYFLPDTEIMLLSFTYIGGSQVRPPDSIEIWRTDPPSQIGEFELPQHALATKPEMRSRLVAYNEGNDVKLLDVGYWLRQ